MPQPHILIADDERSIRLMLETGLTLNGFRVTLARTGREALGFTGRGGTKSPRFTPCKTSAGLLPVNGARPVSRLYRVAPRL